MRKKKLIFVSTPVTPNGTPVQTNYMITYIIIYRLWVAINQTEQIYLIYYSLLLVFISISVCFINIQPVKHPTMS